MSVTGTLADAVARARAFVLDDARRDFEGLRHEMRFPRALGFGGRSDLQISDGFARSVVASLLLESAHYQPDAEASRVAAREAERLARTRLTDRAGGWSYFPDLPDLPPDADSLAAAVRLLSRAAPGALHLADGPVRLVLDGAAAGGGFSTWILAPEDPPDLRDRMTSAVRRWWGDTPDVDVCAHLYLALARSGRDEWRRAARHGAAWIAARQRDDGGWTSTWYYGDVYGTTLCLELLLEIGGQDAAVARGVRFLLASQRADGGWGHPTSTAIDTGAAVWALTAAGVAPARGIDWLLAEQGPFGDWQQTPWIEMAIGRAEGRVLRRATWSSPTVSTAFGLRGLARQLAIDD